MNISSMNLIYILESKGRYLMQGVLICISQGASKIGSNRIELVGGWAREHH